MKIFHRSRAAGFTLIEMLVAISVFTILMIGLLNLLDSSTKVSKIEAALADTQENVRFATYHLLRTSRMMGGSVMPFARSWAGGNAWVSGEVHDNVAANFTVFGGTTLNTMPGSDVLVLRGFFDVAPFFVGSQANVSDVNTSTSTVRVREHQVNALGVPSALPINDFSAFDSVANVFLNRGLVISTSEGFPEVPPGSGLFLPGEYIVAKITNSTGVTGTAPNRQLVLTYGADAVWDGLNMDGLAISAGDPDFLGPPTRVGVLEAYAYYVDANMVLRRVAQSNPGAGEPVAVNIGGLQVALGVDANSDTFLDPATEWDASPTLAEALQGGGALAMRITVLGRTPFEIPDWTEPAVTFSGAGNMAVPTAGTSGPRHAKWRRMDVAVALRNFL